MRLLLALILLAAGAWLLLPDLLPPNFRPSAVPLPAVLTANSQSAGILAGVAGLLLLGLPAVGRILRRSGHTLDDAPIRRELARRGFDMEDLIQGWISRGEWDGVPLVVRRLEGGEASRFARPWMIDISVPGTPSEPWPLMPTQAKLIEVRPGGFTVVMPEVTFPATMARFPQLVTAVLKARR